MALSAAPAMAGYLLVRLIGIGILWGWARSEHQSLLRQLAHKWDSIWYLGIIEHGYDHGHPLQSNLAFFPLYPELSKALATVSPLGTAATAVALAWVGGLAAAWGMYAIGRRLYDHRTGVLLAVLWGVIPHAITESMAYTESLFTALCAWTLYALLNRRWLTAGTLCLLAGLSRPTASALVPVVCLAALIAIVRRRDGWRPYLALVLAPIGWLGYLLWVGLRVHQLDGWFHIQDKGWGSSWDGGSYTLTTAKQILTHPNDLEYYAVTVILVLAVMLFALSLFDRQPWPLLLFSALLLATSLGGAGFYHSKARFLVAAFPLLLPGAVGLAKARKSTMLVVLATLTLISGYFGGYLLLVWNRSP
ncbi:hypothetical protein ACIGXM_18140 [Kitasatospora sp. NPDC052896]|uniref:hypothetical protein n=1 Tax=Kitasatospora sp. NPDC052896 TaxID=3364061 RepID=UPI0037CB0876